MFRITIFLFLLYALGAGCKKEGSALPPNEQAAGIYHGTLTYEFSNPFSQTITPTDLTVTALSGDSVKVQWPDYSIEIELSMSQDSSLVWSHAHAFGGWSLMYYPYQDSATFNMTTAYSMAYSSYRFYGKR